MDSRISLFFLGGWEKKQTQINHSQLQPISPHKHTQKRRKQFQSNPFLMKTVCRFFLNCSVLMKKRLIFQKKKIKTIKAFLVFIPKIFLCR